MRIMNLSYYLMPLAFAAVAGGCPADDDPVPGETLKIAPTQAADNAVKNVRGMMDAAFSTEKFLDEATTLEQVDSVLAALSDDSAEPAPGEPVPEEANTGILLPLDDVDYDELKQSLEDQLREQIFRDDQIESRTATTIVYRISAARVCEVEGELDQDCVKALEAVPLRVAVTSVVEGDIDLRLLVGTDRQEAALLELHADMLALSLNIGPILDALTDALKAVNPDEAPPEVITARGTVRLALRRLSANELRVSGDVVSPVLVEAKTSEGDVSIAAGTGSVALDVDRAAKTASVEFDARDIAVVVPKSVLETEDSCYNELGEYDEALCQHFDGTLSFALARLAGIASLIDASQSATIDGLIAGPFTMKLDDKKVIEFALNDETTPVDISVTTAENLLKLAIDGSATSSLLVEMQHAADVFPDIADGWWLSDLLTVSLTQPATEVHLTSTNIGVDKGQVKLTSRARPDLDRTIDAGMCVAPAEMTYDEYGEPTGDDHPFNLVETSCTPPS